MYRTLSLPESRPNQLFQDAAHHDRLMQLTPGLLPYLTSDATPSTEQNLHAYYCLSQLEQRLTEILTVDRSGLAGKPVLH